MNFKVIIFMVLVVLFTIFIVQNTEGVRMHVFFWQFDDIPKIVLLTITLAVGVILGILISTFINRKKTEDEFEKEPDEPHQDKI